MVNMKIKTVLFVAVALLILTGCASSGYNKQYVVSDAIEYMEQSE